VGCRRIARTRSDARNASQRTSGDWPSPDTTGVDENDSVRRLNRPIIVTVRDAMGIAENVGFSKWPQQSDWLGRRVKVCFEYDADNVIGGEVVRCDDEEPGRMIIKLDDGRFVLAPECMYSFDK
jgi:hypothetical protein